MITLFNKMQIGEEVDVNHFINMEMSPPVGQVRVKLPG